jgi:putative metallohydrolase (TIGR04338 family)
MVYPPEICPKETPMTMTTWTFGTASATRTPKQRKQRKAPKVGPGRDTQKSRVYDAEDLAQINLNGKCRGQTIANADLQAFVDKVLTKATVRRRWPSHGRPGGITARLKRGGSAYGKAGVREIMLPLFARNEWVILHEIAHVLHNHPHDEAPHGPEFVRIEMFLIEQALGKDAAQAFKAACKEKRVRIAPATTLPKPDTTVAPIKTGSARTLARLERPGRCGREGLPAGSGRLRGGQEGLRRREPRGPELPA